MIITINILRVLSDNKTLILFSTIALGKSYDYKTLMKNIGITERQYYSKLRRITTVGLVKRESGKYVVTTLGNIVYEAVSIVDKAMKYYWALKAIESFQGSSLTDTIGDKSMLTSMLIDKLIDDNKLKKILANTPTRI
jgi:hypothetical protein